MDSIFNREKITAKIQALLSKTTAAGATEDEMMSAMLKAHGLMARYNISLSEAEQQREPMGLWSYTFRSAEHKVLLVDIGHAIGIFTDTLSFITDWKFSGHPERAEPVLDRLGFLTFAGRHADVRFALWLAGSLESYTMRGIDQFLIQAAQSKALVTAERSKVRKSYLFGAAKRISQRMIAMKVEADRTRSPVGEGENALVPANKRSQNEKYLEETGIHLDTARKRKTRKVYVEAYASGEALGDRARFNKPVG